MWHVLGREELHRRFRRGNLRETDNLDNLGISGRIILNWTFMKRMGEGHGLAFVWLKTGRGGGLF